ncbi:MAG: hypothetical protein ACI89J_000558 [Hyphomicrobiaceae bacterium]|jgi:hypothetical protein
MKTLIIAIAAAGFSLTALPSTSEAGAKKYRHAGKSYHRKNHRRRFSRHDYNRLPISVTRPPNTGHYTYQGYPLWAARALQPRSNR